jgi:hypothetical protein
MKIDKRKIFFFVVIGVFFFVLCPLSSVFAARLYFTSPELTQSLYAPFEVEVRLDSPDESVNAVDGWVELESDVAVAVSTADGSSIVSLWVEKPAPAAAISGEAVRNMGSKIRFSGIVPGGFQGIGGKLFSFTLEPRDSGELPLHFSSSTKVYLNGPEGASASLVLEPTSVVVRSEKQPVFGVAQNDHDAPETFNPELVRNPQLLDGQWALIFSTTDKNSGLDHYDVWEQPLSRWQRLFSRPSWASATSPYLVADQSLRRVIHVRAVDGAGNMRLAIVRPLAAHRSSVYSIVALVLLLLVGSYVARRWINHRR